MANKRRSSQEVLAAKIEKLENSIATYKEKLEQAEKDKQEAEKELADLIEAENRAKRQKEVEELIDFLDKKGVTVEDIKGLFDNEDKNL